MERPVKPYPSILLTRRGITSPALTIETPQPSPSESESVLLRLITAAADALVRAWSELLRRAQAAGATAMEEKRGTVLGNGEAQGKGVTAMEAGVDNARAGRMGGSANFPPPARRSSSGAGCFAMEPEDIFRTLVMNDERSGVERRERVSIGATAPGEGGGKRRRRRAAPMTMSR